MQLVVVIAVRNAVSAATITFTAISMNLFFIVFFFIVTQISQISQIGFLWKQAPQIRSYHSEGIKSVGSVKICVLFSLFTIH